MNVNIIKSMRNNVSKFFLGNSVGNLASFLSWVTPGAWSRTDLLKQYTRYVYTVVSAIAEESAKIELIAKKEVAGGAKVVVENNPLLQLLKKPNEDTSQFQFLEMHFTLMKLAGESFWYLPLGKRTKQPKEIFLLRPDLVEVAVDTKDPKGLVTGYVLQKPDGTKVTFKKEEVIHFKTPNPLNPYRGMGTVSASKTYIQTEEFSSDWTKNSIYNSGRPSGIVNFKGTITDDQFQSLKRQFKAEYSGVTNAGKTLLTRGADGVDFQKLGMELNGVALRELKELTRDDIMVMFRVSKTILGITDDVNRANAREARIVFRENVVKPEMDRFLDQLNAKLTPMWGENVVIEYEDPATISESEKLEEWKAGHTKWLTTNDIRAEKGLEPVDGGDDLYVPVNLIPLGKKPSNEEKDLKKK
jgi:HK97 family phage portal protein